MNSKNTQEYQDDEIFALAYECFNEDAGPESPDNEIRQSLMEDLRPFLILFARRLVEKR